MLESSDPREIAKWQRKYKLYLRELYIFQEQYDVDYEPPISKWVLPSTWRTISTSLLHERHRTGPREGTNDRRVEQFLRQRGPYRVKGQQAGETLYENPQQHFEAITWPSTKDTSYVKAMDEFLHEWF